MEDPKALSLADLGSALLARHSDTKLSAVLATSKWSVNEEMVQEEEIENIVLKGGDVVAVIPPVSGG
ncbi:hypothetical protein DL93DRAFT_2071957 [Clavulina sp. PMI_390]|nr:hypothetical protein DL93DRAFT_2071957 [Clavulina sp. PMI_390]